MSAPSFRAARCRNIHSGYIKNRQGDAPALIVLAGVTSPHRFSGWCDYGRVVPSEPLPVQLVVALPDSAVAGVRPDVLVDTSVGLLLLRELAVQLGDLVTGQELR